jgi:type IV pilus assembly protein PilE
VDGDCKLASGASAIEAKNFSYTCVSAATTFTITATGLATQGMTGYEYTINQAGAKTSKAGGTTGTGCWLTSKGGSC